MTFTWIVGSQHPRSAHAAESTATAIVETACGTNIAPRPAPAEMPRCKRCVAFVERWAR